MDEHVFDAMRVGIARIVTLGLTGFDSPVNRASPDEARHALLGIADGLRAYGSDLRRRAPAIALEIDSLLRRGDQRLALGAYDEFDRLGFIVDVGNPLARAISAARDTLRIKVPPEPRFWRASAATLFERDAFDADFFRPAWAPRANPTRAALGERLFFDPALSGDGTRSCASCHSPDRAFTDGRQRSTPLSPGATLRNAPTLINAALQGAQFADLRVVYLEDQVTAVVTNEDEMHGSLAVTATGLAKDSAYRARFRAAYDSDSAVTPANIRNALAVFIRSLVRLDSRVDRALRGDTASLTPDERRGFNVFAGKGLCATCHFLPLTNGTVPPAFTKTEQEVIGVPATPQWRRARVSPDVGRAAITRAALHRFAFKTPSLRNVEFTAPYMHNGVYRTLDDVVRFYDGGGGAGIGIDLPNQTLPFARLGLSADERRSLVAFLNALTDVKRVIE
jgi:cytochrome c peroxidase